MDDLPDCGTRIDTACVLTVGGYLAKRMCACKDKACGDATELLHTKWMDHATSVSPSEDDKPSEQELYRIAETMARYRACYTKLGG